MHSSNMQRFGEKMRTLRMRHGMSIRQLTVALGYAGHGYVYDIETGKKKPNAEFILKVADLFDVTTDQLMRDTLDLPDA